LELTDSANEDAVYIVEIMVAQTRVKDDVLIPHYDQQLSRLFPCQEAVSVVVKYLPQLEYSMRFFFSRFCNFVVDKWAKSSYLMGNTQAILASFCCDNDLQ
jgi:hypothetical protein